MLLNKRDDLSGLVQSVQQDKNNRTMVGRILKWLIGGFRQITCTYDHYQRGYSTVIWT